MMAMGGGGWMGPRDTLAISEIKPLPEPVSRWRDYFQVKKNNDNNKSGTHWNNSF